MKVQGPELIRIKASAGAGKTYALSIRFLSLLKKIPPSSKGLRSLIAITFTNKAAIEMRQRILNHLKAIALKSGGWREISRKTGLTPEEAGKWIEVILSNYSDFHIRTVDSLLFSILKGFSFEFSIRPDFNVVFNIDDILDDVFDIILSGVQHDKKELIDRALSTYFDIDTQGGFYPENGLKKRLKALYSKVTEDIAQREIDAKKIRISKEKSERAYKEFLEILSQIDDGAVKRNLIRGLTPNLEADKLLDRAIFKKDVDDLFKKNASVSSDEKAHLERALQSVKKNLRDYERICEEIPYSRVGGYVPLLHEMRRCCENLSLREGLILGSDHWTALILKALQEDGFVPLVFEHFGGLFSHFLFDEFQDTSRQQWEALYPIFEEALSQGGSLFVVGDVKQAIYHWRGGDMELFDEVLQRDRYFPFIDVMKDEILGKNYRAHPALVDFVNRLFAPLKDLSTVKSCIADELLGKNTPVVVKNDLAEKILKAYDSHEQEASAKRPFKRRPKVSIFEVSGSKKEIRSGIKNRLIQKVREEWESRPREDGDCASPIACLVRSHKDAEEVSSWLISEGIPVITENALKLSSSLLVKGIICLMKLINDPADNIALYGLLASKILNFGPQSEEELSKAWLRGEHHKWTQKVNEIIQSLKGALIRRTPYELLQQIIEVTGLSDRIKDHFPDQSVFLERLLEVTHNFETKEGASLQKYLDFWDKGGLEERVGLPENIDAVRVMTIHKAKGLEFPVVFIPFTDWQIKDRTPVDVYNNSLVYLGGKLNNELLRVRGQIWAMEVLESLNLFYVALTRAMERIYFFVTLPKTSGLKPFSVGLRQLIEKAKKTGLLEKEYVCWETLDLTPMPH
ncbi:Helicase domain protein [Dissulfuribacter thermophilus]|uniref:DNA 3'-5' helicase n=1 Tax=Dissulfuribacter thermophilus TaxID=1156395 RepID=A0A1B9F5M5_9BACT|nr:UvrD-helicase domain-containing protein [Dissulfuribacter thermophilus]OCC15247.1 Helicase domain protein [Dissulfuribacter thermophilus]